MSWILLDTLEYSWILTATLPLHAAAKTALFHFVHLKEATNQEKNLLKSVKVAMATSFRVCVEVSSRTVLSMNRSVSWQLPSAVMLAN